MSRDTNRVDTPCVAYEDMSQLWDLIHDLLKRTEGMRSAGEKWLPREDKESLDQYNARLKKTILFSAFEETAIELSNKPFSKPVTIQGIPTDLDYLLQDCDGAGMSINSFIKSCFRDLIIYGKFHILVDYSIIIDSSTLAAEKEQGARVVLIRIPPPTLFGWRSEGIGIQQKLTQIRYYVRKTIADGRFGDKVVDTIKMWTPDTVEEYGQNNKGDWLQTEALMQTFGGIPLVTVYTDPTGLLTADPPLIGLAWLNLLHWQSSSEQRRILSMSRFAILFGKGFERKDVEAGIDIGPMKGIFTTGSEASLTYVEPIGTGLREGREDLKDIEAKMTQLGHRPYEREAAGDTATGKKINEERNLSQMQSWVLNTERGIVQVINLACQWRGIEPPKDLSVDIFSDFDMSVYGSNDKEFLLECRKEGELPRPTFLHEIKRRGVLSERVDVDTLVEELNAEGGKDLLDEINTNPTDK